MYKKILLLCSFSLFAAVPYNAKYSAGIIPYVKQEGKAKILLAEETWNGAWCDFGGSCDVEERLRMLWQGDELFKRCAVREMTEETKYVFGKYTLGYKTEGMMSAMPSGLMQNAMEASMTFLLQALDSNHKISSPERMTYLVEVPYIPSETFEHAVTVDHAEKGKYEWIDLFDLVSEVRRQYIAQGGDITKYDWQLCKKQEKETGCNPARNIRYQGKAIRSSMACMIASDAFRDAIAYLK